MPQNPQDEAAIIRQYLIGQARRRGIQFSPEQLEEEVQRRLGGEAQAAPQPEQTQDPTRVLGSPERRAYLQEKVDRGLAEDATQQFGPVKPLDVIQRTARDVGVGLVSGATMPGRFVGKHLGIPSFQPGGEFDQWALNESGEGMGTRGLSSNPILGTIQSAVEPAAQMAAQMIPGGRAMQALTAGSKANVAGAARAGWRGAAERGAQWGARAMDKVAPGLKPVQGGSQVSNLLKLAPAAAAKGTAANVMTDPESTLTPEGAAMSLLFSLVDAGQASKGFRPDVTATAAPRGGFGQAWDRFKALGAEEEPLVPDMQKLPADVGEQVVSANEAPAPRGQRPPRTPEQEAIRAKWLEEQSKLSGELDRLNEQLDASEAREAAQAKPATPRQPKLPRGGEEWRNVSDEQVQSVMADPAARAEFSKKYANFARNGEAAAAALRGDFSGWGKLTDGMRSTFRKFAFERGAKPAAVEPAPVDAEALPAEAPAKVGTARPRGAKPVAVAAATVETAAPEVPKKAPRQTKLPRAEGLSARQTIINESPRTKDGLIDWDNLNFDQRMSLLGRGKSASAMRSNARRAMLKLDEIKAKLGDDAHAGVLRTLASEVRTPEEYAARVAARKGERAERKAAPVEGKSVIHSDGRIGSLVKDLGNGNWRVKLPGGKEVTWLKVDFTTAEAAEAAAAEAPAVVGAAKPRKPNLARAAAEADMKAEGLEPTPKAVADEAVAGTKAEADPKAVDTLVNEYDSWSTAQRRAALAAIDSDMPNVELDKVMFKKWGDLDRVTRKMLTERADAVVAAGRGKKVATRASGVGKQGLASQAESAAYTKAEGGGPAEARPFRGARKRRPSGRSESSGSE